MDQGRQLRHGRERGNYIGTQLKAKGVSNPIIARDRRHRQPAADPGAQPGFKDALATYGFSVGPRQAARLHRAGGQRVTANLLQAAPKLDAVWNHDDDQGIGVLAAIKQADRSEFFMVGGAGSANAMRGDPGRQHRAQGDGDLHADDGGLRGGAGPARSPRARG